MGVRAPMRVAARAGAARPEEAGLDSGGGGGGPQGARTLDLRVANAALSQLSYNPTVSSARRA